MYYMNDLSAEFALGWRQLYNRGVADVSIATGKLYDALKNKKPIVGNRPIDDIREMWSERQRMVRDLDSRYAPSANGATRQNLDRLDQFRKMGQEGKYEHGGPISRKGNQRTPHNTRMFDDPLRETSNKDYFRFDE